MGRYTHHKLPGQTDNKHGGGEVRAPSGEKKQSGRAKGGNGEKKHEAWMTRHDDHWRYTHHKLPEDQASNEHQDHNKHQEGKKDKHSKGEEDQSEDGKDDKKGKHGKREKDLIMLGNMQPYEMGVG